MNSTHAWWLAARPKTLPASVSPVILGSALAYFHGQFDVWLLLLALICAVALQVAVNFANDYFDHASGVDTEHRLGPVRASQSGMVSAAAMKRALALVCSIALLSGLALCWLSSWALVWFGIAAMVAVFIYSGGPWPLASHGLGEVTVFLFFGWLAVGGSYFAHSQAIGSLVLGFASVAGLISAAIMLVNNIRDIPTDKVAGKYTLAVMLSEARARMLYRYLLWFVIGLHLALVSLLGIVLILPLLLCAPLFRRLFQLSYQSQGQELNALLAQTAKTELVYCLLTSLCLVLLPTLP
ncbi:1,4-dihydroxy-2-naphthoate polyprenyltransferase [Reinekea thalattae]|uniref:1,4-dihydroxy-2-naphthoate octaprenyltransferase n=1 Tax=Reinekea thalattae TaxID=2593301 RepID=A0A5C8Z701_9GAMM|nr:1,4-dihydroxy-2-naphthoate polyprenyltransferase [Reinekea thalattae]TXR53008.1 1,4-dihydroxy-2-naphthoate polyprenyltransferase [Reinekea thalattae]